MRHIRLLAVIAILEISCGADDPSNVPPNDADVGRDAMDVASDAERDADVTSPEFVLTDEIDPHVLLLSQGISDAGLDPLSWPSEQLREADYRGALIPPRGVLAQFYGNRFDLCVVVRQLLSAQGIPSRYLLWGDDGCGVEASTDRGPRFVPLAVNAATEPPADAAPALELPPRLAHTVEIIERIHGADGVTSSSLGSVTTHALGLAPLGITYEGGIVVVEVGDERWTGADITAASRHDLIFRHASPDGTVEDHVRMLFDSTSGIANPDADDGDRWVAWVGANAVTQTFLRAETLIAAAEAPKSLDQAETTSLWLRVLELAMETDHALWQAFAPDGDPDAATEGGALFDVLRILIAGREQHGADGPTVPTFDLLANPRHLVGLAAETDAPGLMSALGIVDTLVETNTLANASGAQPMTLATLFSAMATELADSASRQDFFDDALARLRVEGVTEEMLTFWDAESTARAEVVLVGTELVLRLADDDRAAFAAASGPIWESVAETREGAVLPEDGRGLVVEALLLWQGAALNFLPRLSHVESPQLALATPRGTVATGSGTYTVDGEAPHIFTFHAIAREFESPSGDEHDNADWQRVDDDGRLIAGGSAQNETATLSEARPHLMQWGADDATTSRYDSPLWLAPAVAAGFRAGIEVEVRMAYDVPDSVTEWQSVTFSEYATRRLTLVVDGESVGVEVIDATDAEGAHSVTIARHGLTRLVLEMQTPVGEAGITELLTSRALRLRGRVVSGRGPQNRQGEYAMTLGVAEAGVATTGFGQVGNSWPDGTIDARVTGTEQATLRGSIALLVDSSFSMEQQVDLECVTECATKMDVVLEALDQIARDAPALTELALWKFESYLGPLPDGPCPQEMQIVTDWSLDPSTVSEASLYFTSKTPLSGAVRAALAAIDDTSWGGVRRLIVLADGDDDCSDSLSDITGLPSNLQIHTIGVGIDVGSDAELDLQMLAARTRGTYTRTSGAEELASALTALASAPIDIPPDPVSLPVELSAGNHLPLDVEFPVDIDDVTFTLTRDPAAPTPTQVLALQPDDSYPSELFEHSAEAVSRITEARERDPELVILTPDRMIAFGLISETLAWFEYNPTSGAMVAVTLDSLHGASAIYTAALVAGLFTGVLGVISAFDDCVLEELGCGSNLEEIQGSICNSPGVHAFAILVSYVTIPLSFFESLGAGTFYNGGIALVEAACGGTNAVTNFATSSATGTVQSVISAGVGGGIPGWLVNQVPTN
jgi:hypothetical protein